MPLLFLFVLLVLSSFPCQSQEWQLKKSQQDVRVYLEESSQSLRSVKAELIVQSSLYAIVNILRDLESAPEWMESVEEVELLAREDVDTDLVATTLDLPWPFLDRLMVTRSRICHNDDTLIISIWDETEAVIDKPNTVRMSEVKGQWRVTTLPDNRVKISYQGAGYPGGIIPNWLARGKLVSSTFKTFLRLQDKIVATKYQEKPLGYEKMKDLDACNAP